MNEEGSGRREIDSKTRVAVLPFANVSPDPTDAYFADGMTDELIVSVSRVPTLRVIARSSIMPYKGGATRIPEIAQDLKVAYVIEGSVRKAGDTIRVSVQLVDAVSEENLWTNVYDRKLDDVLGVQSDIAEKVTEALRINLVPDDINRLRKRDTSDPIAFTLYLQGQQLMNERTQDSVRQALKKFEFAIGLDPNYARAHAAMGFCYSFLIQRGGVDQKEGAEKSKEEIEKALEIDDRLSEAHAILGLQHYLHYEYNEAESELAQAILLNPSYAPAHQWRAINLRALGSVEEGLAEFEKAHELDPLSAQIMSAWGMHCFLAGRDEEAMEKWNNVLERYPNFVNTHLSLAQYYIAKSKFDEAKACLIKAQKIDPALVTDSDMGFIYAASGEKEKAIGMINRLKELLEAGVASYGDIAFVYAGLSDRDEFFKWMNQAVEEYGEAADFLTSPLLKNMREDPRFDELLKKVNLSSSRDKLLQLAK